MSAPYSRQILFTYCNPGFALYATCPADEEWVIKDACIQYQAASGQTFDIAVFDGTNWGSLYYGTQSGAQLNENLTGLYTCVEPGQTIVAVLSPGADVAVLLSGFRLRI